MEITFIGATRTVTGSLHLFEFNQQKFIVECGLYQGHREEAERINRTFPFKPRNLRSVILSHAHIDHSGNLPNLVKCGFSGPIYCTPGTRDIAELLLLDSAKIHEADFAYLNKKQEKAGYPVKEPLYTVADADRTVPMFTPVPYQRSFEPVKGVKATFYDAGHILGSAVILLEADHHRILFSGDLGRKNMPIINDPTVVKDISTLILESTYGGRVHDTFDKMIDEFQDVIEIGKKQKSKIIIPAFAVERTQVMLTMLKELHHRSVLAGIPVYVDSPLATDVTEVFLNHPECFDEETYNVFRRSNPFNFPGLHYIQDSNESKTLNNQTGPMIIISASGMCEGGRVTHHLIHSIEDPNNIILITGFQARGTLGRRILEGAKEVRIFNGNYERKAQVFFMAGLSAHADGNDLVEYVKKTKNPGLKNVLLIHGDIEEATALKNSLTKLDIKNVSIPQFMTRIIV
ncbi:hypothetical protein A2Y85_00780 [candidate division WOR-3 bacterium RBG_13_43_14]|uniref:MBL fold metallo-hydrolase n=1 Tax=candidate division WOR-3 bacterium RBG_13_43_14 TaxID=1802590 RepID=A0A1F4U3U0_UNCW3|nr:MAG: hypothetical protein A2Y85_00780 [candidate division WOR-3 bacterium RBG_13_43_14]